MLRLFKNKTNWLNAFLAPDGSCALRKLHEGFELMLAEAKLRETKARLCLYYLGAEFEFNRNPNGFTLFGRLTACISQFLSCVLHLTQHHYLNVSPIGTNLCAALKASADLIEYEIDPEQSLQSVIDVYQAKIYEVNSALDTTRYLANAHPDDVADPALSSFQT